MEIITNNYNNDARVLKVQVPIYRNILLMQQN